MKRLLIIFATLACAVNVAYGQKLEARKIKNRKVAYVSVTKLKRYPFPVLNIVREGLARRTDMTEIMERIVYPVINKSNKPIAAIIIEFYPDQPDIGVTVIWHGVEYLGVLIKRNSDGHFDVDAYKVFFEEIGT